MLTEFEGRVAVVTGAGSGIGAALCRGFAAEGMRVVAADIVADAAVATAQGLPDAIGVQVDVADPASVDALAARAYESFGAVDVLCNNAGVFQGGLSWQRTLSDWEWSISVNLFGCIHGVRSFVPRMIEQGTPGHVVNTASIAAFVSGPYMGPYGVSKAAVFAFSEALAHDLAAVRSQIGVSVLAPAAMATNIAASSNVRSDRFGVDATDDGAAMARFLADTTAAGRDPSEAVGPVLEAIRRGEFLIPTRPGYASQIASRAEALVARRLPVITEVD